MLNLEPLSCVVRGDVLGALDVSGELCPRVSADARATGTMIVMPRLIRKPVPQLAMTSNSEYGLGVYGAASR